MGNNFEVGFLSSVNPPKCLAMKESFLDAIEAIKPQENMELILFVLSGHNLAEENVSMRFSLIACNLGDLAMQSLNREGCPQVEIYTTVQRLFQDLCAGWVPEQSFWSKKQELVNLIKTWLVQEKEITGHFNNDRQHPLWMLYNAMDLCLSPDLCKQIKGIQKYIKAVSYSNDRLLQQAHAENIIIGDLSDLFEPELGDCFGRKED